MSLREAHPRRGKGELYGRSLERRNDAGETHVMSLLAAWILAISQLMKWGRVHRCITYTLSRARFDGVVYTDGKMLPPPQPADLRSTDFDFWQGPLARRATANPAN